MTQREQEWYDTHLQRIIDDCSSALNEQDIGTIKDTICWIRDTAYTALCAEYLHTHPEE